jgi:hypothetical protein
MLSPRNNGEDVPKPIAGSSPTIARRARLSLPRLICRDAFDRARAIGANMRSVQGRCRLGESARSASPVGEQPGRRRSDPHRRGGVA